MVNNISKCCTKSIQNHISKLVHDSLIEGHLGIDKTLSRITKHLNLHQIWNCVTKFCKTCRMSESKRRPVAPLKPVLTFEKISSASDNL